MVWGEIRRDGKSELVMCEGGVNSAKYTQILKEVLLPTFASAHVDKKQHFFMEDGAPVIQQKRHKLGTKKMAYRNCWPSQSPDMYPIEHKWHILDLAIRRRTPKAAKKEILLQYIQEEWEKIAMSKGAEIVNWMPTSVEHLAQARGRRTRF